jgi:hypothetical protein
MLLIADVDWVLEYHGLIRSCQRVRRSAVKAEVKRPWARAFLGRLVAAPSTNAPSHVGKLRRPSYLSLFLPPPKVTTTTRRLSLHALSLAIAGFQHACATLATVLRFSADSARRISTCFRSCVAVSVHWVSPEVAHDQGSVLT